MAVIIFEITGQMSYMIPVMIATVTSVFVANVFNVGFYDRMIELKNLPFLGAIKHKKYVACSRDLYSLFDQPIIFPDLRR